MAINCLSLWKLLIIFIIPLNTGEIIKVENDTHIHCIDDVDKDSALFLTPPLKKIQRVQNLKDNLTWKNNDWTLVNGSTLNIAPIMDKSWEDLPMYKKNYTHLILNTAVSVSVYSPYGLEIFVYNHNQVLPRENFDVVYKESKWYHYTVLSKNGTVYLFENNKIIDQDNFVPTSVVFRNLNCQFYFKIHQDNKFWWSNKETEDEKPSIIKIPPTGKSYLLLYTSLCKKCYLKVLHNGKKLIINSTKQQDNLMESWQMYRLKINPDKEDTLKIYRKMHSNDSTGHWALDFSLCDLNNTVTYRKEEESSETNYICNVLNIISNKRAKRSSSHQEKPCPAGKLGKNCDINCKNVVDSTLPYCDRHVICKENTVCSCAWGYSGQFCNHLCKEGKWGLSCKEDCKGCTSCDKHTGECKSINLLVSGVVVAVLLVVVVGASVVIKSKLKEKDKTSNDNNTCEDSTPFNTEDRNVCV